jgi:WD40-like Beta Propeller Repeat
MRMVRGLALIALLCGCEARLGQIQTDTTGGDATPSPGDGNSTTGDGSGPPADAAPLGAFTTPTELTNTAGTGASVDDPTMSSDELDIIYAVQANGASTKQLWEITRATTSSPWSTPVERTELNIGTSEESPRFSLDDKTIYYGVDGDIYQATRGAIGQAFGTPAKVAAISTANYEKWMAICTGNVVMVSRQNGTTSNMDLYEGTLTGGANTIDTILNSTDSEISTFLSKDCLTVYYASNRSGQTQLYTSTRTAVGQPWATPTMVDSPFSSAEGTDNEDPWISIDLRTFLLASIRGTSTTKQLYISTR